MSGWRRWLRLLVVLGLTMTAFFTLPISTEMHGAEWVRAAAGVLAIALLVVLVLRQVQLQVHDPERRIDGLLVAIVIGVTTFALVFYAIAMHQPDQFSGMSTRIDALYYTMTTLLTVGYGDIYAKGQLARGLVLVAMVFNVVVIATAATTLSNQIRTRALARSEERQERLRQRKPK
jgi:voltage-gated potassium channel